jgi:hypothetical protein
MSEAAIDKSWIWNPDWNDNASSTSAGGFVDFRKTLDITDIPDKPLKIQISADTRYKLWINSQLVHTGPVKGDAQEWFFDELDIQSFLRKGENKIAVRVLRLFPGSHHGVAFVRMPVGGLHIVTLSQDDEKPSVTLDTNESWESSIDFAVRLPCDLKDDDFLHVYEDIDNGKTATRHWIPAQPHKFMASYGLGPFWNLTPRSIPFHRTEAIKPQKLHNIASTMPADEWEALLLDMSTQVRSLTLPRGTKHHIELEVASHTTAFLKFTFARPQKAGSTLRVTYAECYEDEPVVTPYIRRKGDRTDSTKGLYGPHDTYAFGGQGAPLLQHELDEVEKEIYSPFHFRTFRILSIDILVAAGADLTFYGLQILQTNYDLDVQDSFDVGDNQEQNAAIQSLRTTSLRTLRNCMHDTYEDCPFYEQLQYAMDTRSSALFTYCVSGDDRLARQAIRQLCNSFQPRLGLTASRAPSHQLQIIPHFSLYWVCMVFDHFKYFGDAAFTTSFLSVIDAVLRSFEERIDTKNGLIRAFNSGDKWEFVDWIPAWKPFGIPPSAQTSGYLSFTNCLYAYTLKYAASSLQNLGHSMQAEVYSDRAKQTIHEVREHCYDGKFFTDGLAKDADHSRDYSPHSQIWAVLSGCISGEEASRLLRSSLSKLDSGKGPFDSPSVAMLFYTLRALSEAGEIYDESFKSFWTPWYRQLEQNVTTWVEDDVSQRSDCHAWGSAPLYELMAEVAGITPAEPGFRSVEVRPRTNIYSKGKARMPINGVLGRGLVDVEWEHSEHRTHVTVKITESVGSTGLKDITVYTSLPNGERRIGTGLGPHVWSLSDE